MPGREDFRGESYHTGLWPATPVDFAGKRVAVIGTGSSGVQLIPAIAGEVASLTVYQRTANWCTPLNNAPITPDEQAQLRADFEAICETLNTSPSGFLHRAARSRHLRRLRRNERRAFFEKMWNSPGFSKLTSNYTDLLLDPAANAEWCEFIAEKIRSIVKDPETAEKLIPKDHRFGEKRPPFVTGYYETYNKPNVSLVDLKQTPIVRDDRARHRDGRGRARVRHRRVGDRLRLRHRRARRAWGSAAETVSRSRTHWADGPRTFLGVQTTGFPNFFFPGGPHAAAGNNPRYNGDQVDFITDTLVYVRDHGYDTIEVDPAAEERWTSMVDRGAKSPASFGESSYYFGTNIPGKPRRYLLNSGGRPSSSRRLRSRLRVETDYKAFSTVATGVSRGAHDSGHPQRGRGEQESAPVVLAQPGRKLVQVPHLPERDAEPEQAEVVDRKERVPARVAVLAEQPLDRVVVRHQRRDLRLGDPLQQRLVARVEVRAHRVDLHGIRIAVPFEDLGRESRCAAGACRLARRRRRPPP